MLLYVEIFFFIVNNQIEFVNEVGIYFMIL